MKFFLTAGSFGAAPLKKIQTSLILAFEANSALSWENETKIVKITHSEHQRGRPLCQHIGLVKIQILWPKILFFFGTGENLYFAKKFSSWFSNFCTFCTLVSLVKLKKYCKQTFLVKNSVWEFVIFLPYFFLIFD